MASRKVSKLRPRTMVPQQFLVQNGIPYFGLVENMFNILAIKQAIALNVAIPAIQQCFHTGGFSGPLVLNSVTLASLNLMGAPLFVTRCVTVASMTGTTGTISLDSTDTILNLKQKIAASTLAIPVAEQCLVAGTTPLVDNQLASSYPAIVAGSTINLVSCAPPPACPDVGTDILDPPAVRLTNSVCRARVKLFAAFDRIGEAFSHIG
jgi:hypothetical protein